LSPTHKQLLLDHFHTASHGDLRTILGVYISIIRAFEAALEFQCETTCEKDAAKGTCVGGYAVASQLLGGFGPIHLCFDLSPGGCDFATSANNENIALLIHEAAHRHAGVDDKAYHWDPKYKTLSAEDAMDNADSYARFAILV